MKCPYCNEDLQVNLEALDIIDHEDTSIAALTCANCDTFISTYYSTVNVYMDVLKDKILALSRKFDD